MSVRGRLVDAGGLPVKGATVSTIPFPSGNLIQVLAELKLDWDKVWISVHAGDPELKLGPDEEAIGYWEAIGMPADDLQQRRVQGGGRAAVGHGRLDVGAVLAGGALGRLAQQEHALRELAGEVGLAGVDLALELGAPRGEGVGPRLDRPFPDALDVDGEAPRPPIATLVGVDPVQRLLAPLRGALRAGLDDGAQDVGAVAEDERRDLVGVARDRLGAVPAAVDERPGVLDLDARLPFARAGHWPRLCPLFDRS